MTDINDIKNEVDGIIESLKSTEIITPSNDIDITSKLHCALQNSHKLTDKTILQDFTIYFNSLRLPLKNIMGKYAENKPQPEKINSVMDEIKKNAKANNTNSNNTENKEDSSTVIIREQNDERQIKKSLQRREILFQVFLEFESYDLLSKEILTWEGEMNMNTIYNNSLKSLRKLMEPLTYLLDPLSIDSFSTANFHCLLSKLCELYSTYKFTLIKDLCVYFEADIKSLLNIDPDSIDDKLGTIYFYLISNFNNSVIHSYILTNNSDGKTTIDYQVGKRKQRSKPKSEKFDVPTTVPTKKLNFYTQSLGNSNSVSSMFQTVTIKKKKQKRK